MPSTFLGLNTSYTGLVAANAGLNTTANNISNIETKGYSRQVVNQSAASALRTFTSYGCVGAGVDTLGAERVRDIYYDQKYWNNNSKVGEYDKKQYYAAIVENYLQDTKGSNAVIGFTTIFDEMDAAMQSLLSHTGDTTYASAFIGKAGNLCEYFNLLYNNFQNMQNDINDEIQICVSQINSKAQELVSLNKEINVIERDGTSIANELRDKRDLIIDELSKIVDVEVKETDIIDAATGQPSGMKNYYVGIAGGQTLVDGYDYRVLECVPRESYEKENINDVDGLYDIYWTDTNEELGVYSNSMKGELKGLFEMRDGNNDEAFHGKVTNVNVDNQTVKIKVTEDYLKDLSKSTLPLTDGRITVGGAQYVYESWDFELDDNGDCYYTFHLDTEKSERIGTDKASAGAKVGEQVDYQGIAYYLEQFNEWVRDYTYAFNNIYGQENATDYNGTIHKEEDGNCIFFTGTDGVSGEQYKLTQGLNKNQADGYTTLTSVKSFNSKATDSYLRLTAGNFNVEKSVENDPSTMVTHNGGVDGTLGESAYDIVGELINLSTDKAVMQFRGCKAEDFLVCLMGDAALNAESANNFQSIYKDINNTIANNRISISGVDADEEAANLMTFQTAYSLSSKMISVLCEVYDKLIEETGV